ncbi:MAG: A/G-specific adenine glycosylase [Candidatus Limnocylindrales bacterium]
MYTPSGLLLRWYGRRARPLPWRRTSDPYAILVSEMMAQQTQIARVVPAYDRFLERFPTLAVLAGATLGDVLREWSGLGYNRRARDLHRIARSHPGGLPRTAAELDALPGVGAYTAGAVACFAHGDPVPFADTNIRRVLGRVFLGHVASEQEAVRLDEAHLSRRAPARWHSALMDLGATICTARAPRCGACPFRARCLFREGSTPPVASSKAPGRGYDGSDRRVRGRIVALLATTSGGLTPADLRQAIDDERVPRLIDALVKDGLVERQARRVRLPE